jgi:hypothetical protein
VTATVSPPRAQLCVRRVVPCLAIALGSLACRGPSWIIAGDWVSEGVDGGAGSIADAAPLREACPTAAGLDALRSSTNPAPTLDARFAGAWRGSLAGDAATGFPSADVELRIGTSESGSEPSSLRFGSAAAASAELEPSRGYLCSGSAGGVRCATASGYVAGFSYPLEAVMSRGDVLSFRVVGSDPWDAWCRLQSPEPRPEPAEPCGTAFGVGPPGSDSVGAAGCARVTNDGTATAIDCELMYALQHCRCGSDTCVAEFADAMQVGLRLSDGLLIGSLWYKGDLDAAGVSLARP